MNFSISSSKSKSKKFKYGLNDKNSNSMEEEEDKPSSSNNKNVFGDDDSDDSNDGDGDVNKQIRKEQDALRKRAQKAALNNPNSATYDFDGTYDDYNTKNDNKKQQQHNEEDKAQKQKQGSKYIQDLLKASESRKRERELIYERKMAKEQQQEEETDPNLYQGKERFITSSYKRKLEERDAYQQTEKQKQLEEANNDITKKTTTSGSAGVAFANFYGNLAATSSSLSKSTQNRNIEEQVKGTADENETSTITTSLKKDDNDGEDFHFSKGSNGGGMRFLSGFERADEKKENDDDRYLDDDDHGVSPTSSKRKDNDNDSNNNLSMREIRMKKVTEARVRYLARRNMKQQQ